MFRSIILFCSLLVGGAAMAEPWLASRFSQNCAGCHSPGRKNLEASKRRCSLSVRVVTRIPMAVVSEVTTESGTKNAVKNPTQATFSKRKRHQRR